VYAGAEVLVQDEDTRDIAEPIVAPTRAGALPVLVEDAVPSTTYSTAFLGGLLANPVLQRCVAVAGHLHHGKTALMDLLIEQTHVEDETAASRPWAEATARDRPRRYTDARCDEQDRQLSIKATPVSIVLPSSSGKSFLLHAADCPGHPAFDDELCAAMRLVDGLVLVVDAVEGVLEGTRRALRAAARELPVAAPADGAAPAAGLVLVVNKVDRLALDLRLAPEDAYQKLRFVIDEASAAAAEAFPPGSVRRFDPVDGNVVFASARHGWCFTLRSFAGQ